MSEERAVEEEASPPSDNPEPETPTPPGRRKHPGSRTVKKRETVSRPTLTAEQRLLVLDAWLRSKLPATEFAPLVGMSHHTLYSWKRRFDEDGPAGLSDQPRGAPPGSRLSEATRRAIVMMKEGHPDWGTERLHDMLVRTEGLYASPGAILRVLREEGYEIEHVETTPHAPKVQHFERARPNQLWQSDIFTFVLKRENRRVYLVVFLDDHSRFVVGYGLHATASSALVREVLGSAIANFGAPEEVLTDNGPQYQTWRGKSSFTRLLEKRGIRHVLARPRHPQTLGKTERFWSTLWKECLESAIFQGIDDARSRLGHFIDFYNFQRTHQGIGGLVPADRYFSAAPEVRKTLEERVARNAIDLARHGAPRKSFYLTGRVGEQGISLHGEGGAVVLTTSNGTREEVLVQDGGLRAGPGESTELPPPAAVEGKLTDPSSTEGDSAALPPGASPLDESLERLGRDLYRSIRATQEATDDESQEDSDESQQDHDDTEPSAGGAEDAGGHGAGQAPNGRDP